MSNKKTLAASASAFAAFALVGCNKEEVQTPAPVQPATVTPSAETNPAPVAAPALVSTGVNAAPVAAAERAVEFNQPYSIGEQTAYLKGRLVLENGIVKSVEVVDPKGPQATFAAGIADEAYGKPVKGLQIETISGASLTSAAFNEFLKTVE